MCKIKGRHEKLKGIVVVSKQRWTKRSFTEEILQAFRFTGIRFKTTHSHIHCISYKSTTKDSRSISVKMLCKKNMCAHKLFTYPIRAFIIKHSSEHIAKFEAKVVKMISIKSVSLKRLLQQLKSLCARSKVKSVNYFDCVPFPRFPADPFFAVYNKTKHVRTP